MKKWEYMEKTIDHMEDTVSAVNKYGQDGWELVSVVAMFHSLNRSLIFKREIPEPQTAEQVAKQDKLSFLDLDEADDPFSGISQT